MLEAEENGDERVLLAMDRINQRGGRSIEPEQERNATDTENGLSAYFILVVERVLGKNEECSFFFFSSLFYATQTRSRPGG
jgi:hypothetical protein